MALKSYKITLLGKEKNLEWEVAQISSESFDDLFGFDPFVSWTKENVKKLAESMIRPNILKDLYNFLDENREMSGLIKNGFISCLLGIHYDSFPKKREEKDASESFCLVSHEFKNNAFHSFSFLNEKDFSFEEQKKILEGVVDEKI